MTPIFVLSMLLCVLFCGLTLDLGNIELMKLRMQSASDAAAVGAELEAERADFSGNYHYDWIQQGQQDAAINGFTDGQNGATVAIIQNPTTGAYQGRYDAIQVTITQTLQTVFMGAINSGTYTLTVQSAALVPTCSYFLGGQSLQYNYNFYNASATLNSFCGVYVNYNYAVDGFSKLFGFGVNVSGPASPSFPGGWESQQPIGPASNPGQYPTYNQPVVSDPLATVITQPVFNGSCQHTSLRITSGTANLSPGNYCGTLLTPGLTISNATVNLSPGLYIFTGGASWNTATVTGTGVTLFFTQGNGAGYGQFLVGNAAGGQSTLILSAPVDNSAGGIPTILFFCGPAMGSDRGDGFPIQHLLQCNGRWHLVSAEHRALYVAE